MYQVIRSKSARDDIKKIANYIGQDNPYAAMTFTQEMIDNFTKVASLYPKMGKKCKKFYYSVYKKYLIFYKINEAKKLVSIVHIIRGTEYTAYKHFF